MRKILRSALRDCGFSFNIRKDASVIYFGLSYAIAFLICASDAPLWLMAIVGINAVVSSLVVKSDVQE